MSGGTDEKNRNIQIYCLKKSVCRVGLKGLLLRFADGPEFREWVFEINRYATQFGLGDHVIYTSIRIFSTYLASLNPDEHSHKWSYFFWYRLAAVWISTKIVYDGKSVTASKFLQTLHHSCPTPHVKRLIDAEVELSRAIDFEFDKPQQDDCLHTLSGLLHIPAMDMEAIKKVLHRTSYGSQFLAYSPLELTAAAILTVSPRYTQQMLELDAAC